MVCMSGKAAVHDMRPDKENTRLSTCKPPYKYTFNPSVADEHLTKVGPLFFNTAIAEYGWPCGAHMRIAKHIARRRGCSWHRHATKSCGWKAPDRMYRHQGPYGTTTKMPEEPAIATSIAHGQTMPAGTYTSTRP